MIQIIINAFVIIVISLLLIRSVQKSLSRYTLVNKYKNCLEILDYFLDKSYQIIYKDQLITYTSTGVVPQKDELETAKRNFIKLSFRLMGPEIEDILLNFYGDRETLITNMLTYFQEKLDSDEISNLTQQANELNRT